jgi:transcriptional regulator with XRE-family HTH domain
MLSMNYTGATRHTGFDYALIASELIRALRGKRSQAAFSRKLGYRSNMVNRWESGDAFPTAATLLRVLALHQKKQASPLLRFFPRAPEALGAVPPASPAQVAAFLQELRGKTPILSIAAECGVNRYSVSRWLSGGVEPRLPQFFQLIEVMSRRLIDFLACCTDPAHLPSITRSHERLALARQTAYDQPLSHAVLRALELGNAPEHEQAVWLADRLGMAEAEVRTALGVLEATGQVERRGERWSLKQVLSVNTSQDRARARALKASWARAAVARLESGAPGSYGYSVFSISKHDLRRLRDVHLEYVRAMQAIIAASRPGECVGLYCAQLLDLARSDNALADT